MAAKMYAGAVKTAAKGGGTAVWAHGLGADPDFVAVTPVKVLVGPIAIAITHDATNVTVTNNDAASDIDVSCVAAVMSTVADEAAALLNTAHRTSNGNDHANVVLNNTHRGDATGADHSTLAANATSGANAGVVINKGGTQTRKCQHRVVPTAFGTLHRHAVSLRTLAASATETLTVANLQALGGSFAVIDYDKVLDIVSDNPAVTIDPPTVDGTTGELVSILIRNNDTVNQQQFNLHVREIHSVSR